MDLDKAWEYFSNPANLEKITPPEMQFKITSTMLESRTYPGQIISYKVSPFPGFRSNWVTEIRAVEEKHYFINEQRFGPYAFWHHTHWFKPENSCHSLCADLNHLNPQSYFYISRV